MQKCVRTLLEGPQGRLQGSNPVHAAVLYPEYYSGYYPWHAMHFSARVKRWQQATNAAHPFVMLHECAQP
jgi:hypothetical protein